MKTLHPLVIGYTDNHFESYTPGDDQKVITLGVWIEEDDIYTAEQMGEVVFEAMNVPVVLAGNSVTGQIQTIWRAMTHLRSLSKGDTVTWDGVTVAVESAGFRRVSDPQSLQTELVVSPAYVREYGLPQGYRVAGSEGA